MLQLSRQLCCRYSDWGTAITIWVAVRDRAGPSLAIENLSQSALSPAEKDSFPGLEITVDGTAVHTPVLSVPRISNDGGKTITSKDFDGPLEVVVGPATVVPGLPAGQQLGSPTIVRARVSGKSPVSKTTRPARVDVPSGRLSIRLSGGTLETDRWDQKSRSPKPASIA